MLPPAARHAAPRFFAVSTRRDSPHAVMKEAEFPAVGELTSWKQLEAAGRSWKDDRTANLFQ